MMLLRKYASNKEMNEYVTLFDQGKYEELFQLLMENYYDPKYMNSMKRHNFRKELSLTSIDEFFMEMKNLYNLI